MKLKTIDNIFNFVPDMGFKIGEKIVDNLERINAVTLISVPLIGYAFGDSIQAGGIGYAAAYASESPLIGVTSAVAAFIAPPAIRIFRLVLDSSSIRSGTFYKNT